LRSSLEAAKAEAAAESARLQELALEAQREVQATRDKWVASLHALQQKMNQECSESLLQTAS
jgi:hypothetical protein